MDSIGYGPSLGRKISGSSSEKIVFYVDEAVGESYPGVLSCDRQADSGVQKQSHCSGLYPPRHADISRRSNSICSQSNDRPRRSRPSSDSDPSGSRRTSVHSNRSRTNSCSRPTPLGDGRRASVCRKGPSRRASNAACAAGTGSRRKDSVRPTTRIEIRESKGKIVVMSPLELEQARRHRRIGMIIMGTFSFLLMASILAVVVTLTHSSFHTPPIGSKELAEHRANLNYHPSLNDTLRKENEELLNSLNQDNSLPENSTTSL